MFIRSFPYRFLRVFENYNYACHRWFAIIRKSIPWQITSSLFSTFLLVPIFLIIRSKYIVISLQKSAEMKFIGGLYVFYFLVILLFETYSRSNFPYSFLLLLLIICSSDEKHNTEGLEKLHERQIIYSTILRINISSPRSPAVRRYIINQV